MLHLTKKLNSMKIVSGGQTGVDRAALDAAIHLGITHGGWCPKGRNAEDGMINEKYALSETSTSQYSERTKLNVRDSDGTLIFLANPAIGGTDLTIKHAEKLKKPLLIVDLKNYSIDELQCWIEKNNIRVLNVAGPRESQEPGIYDSVYNLLHKIFNMNRSNTLQEKF